MVVLISVMLADYHVVRKRHLKIEDLYVGNSTSIYWYNGGFHWRAFLAFATSTIMFFPGFVMSLMGRVNGWTHFFNISFLVGLVVAFVTYLGICWVSPPKGIREGLTYLVRARLANLTFRTMIVFASLLEVKWQNRRRISSLATNRMRKVSRTA